MTAPEPYPRVVQPGDFFIRANDNHKRLGDRLVFRCDHVVADIVRCYEQEGPKGRRTDRMFRSILIDTVERVLKGSEV